MVLVRQRERSLPYVSPPHMVTLARAGPGRSQEPGVPSGYPL